MKKLLFGGLLSLVSSLLFAQESPLWMRYPSISPDGKTIVFSYKGDLYRVPTAGGAAVPLTLHEAQDYMPVWSHDGKSIAFASDRYGNFDVFVMPATGGEAKRLTFHSAADLPSDFSPDDKQVIFQSNRNGTAANAQFPRLFDQLYSVSVQGGMAKLMLNFQAENARYSADGKKLIFHDWKGYEDDWRKHHTSSVTRDVWMYDFGSQKFTQITAFNGEDRSPLFTNNESEIVYLSEENGSFNVFKRSLNAPVKPVALTSFTKHPVRFLSRATDGTLCFGYHGEIYTLKEGGTPQKVNIQVSFDGRLNTERIVSLNSGATEMALSPNGKEVAFVFRGEVFVTSVEGGITKRVTNTPEQERSVSFSPDGRSVIYAAERNNNWDIYRSSIGRSEEPYFYASTILKEEALIATDAEEFQPKFSPDGKEIAYLEERTILRVFNLASKQSRTLIPANTNYSYSDGDQYFAWSPDSKWVLAEFSNGQIFSPEAGLIAADGKSPIVNLTQSGYSDGSPKWAMDGKAMIWYTDRDGMKNHGSWGGENDVYAMFFTQDAYDRFRLSKEDFALLKEKEDKEKKEKDEKDKKEKDEASKALAEAKATKKPEVPAKASEAKDDKSIKMELDGIENRKIRLTIHSSDLSDAVLSPDGEKLYYLARFEGGNDLWVTETRTRETKILVKGAGFAMEMTKDGKALFVLGQGGISKIETESGKRSPVNINGEMSLNYLSEKAYIFDHAWRQVLKKFYVTDLHGVDWKFYYNEYKKFLPHINNNHDFAEMLSEMLGELNASHTGCRYSPSQQNTDATASLGLFYDEDYSGIGVKVGEVIAKGPLAKANSKVRVGHIIEKIDGVEISPTTDYNQLLNRKAGKNTLLSVLDPSTNTRWEEVVKPISRGEEGQLLYRRWVENRRKEVDKLSNGTVGYVHVQGMNDGSFRTVVDEVLGKSANKESLIVDTRFNGGGWLHDDLATFLNGRLYMSFVPRGMKGGHEPMRKWVKPSAILVGESNYSDAHMFPYTYRDHQVGKIIGMPVPGTGTAVWWESQIDPTLVFGIPQVGMVGLDGKYLENNQLEPDIKVKNEPELLLKSRDQQLERAVEELRKNPPKPVGLNDK